MNEPTTRALFREYLRRRRQDRAINRREWIDGVRAARRTLEAIASVVSEQRQLLLPVHLDAGGNETA